jgi:hypothetical protein
MNKKRWIAIAPGILALVVGAFVIGLLLVKLLWAWAIPDLLPGAVEQGLVAASISWFTAFKLAVLLSVVAGAGGLFSAPRERTPGRGIVRQAEESSP